MKTHGSSCLSMPTKLQNGCPRSSTKKTTLSIHACQMTCRQARSNNLLLIRCRTTYPLMWGTHPTNLSADLSHCAFFFFRYVHQVIREKTIAGGETPASLRQE